MTRMQRIAIELAAAGAVFLCVIASRGAPLDDLPKKPTSPPTVQMASTPIRPIVIANDDGGMVQTYDDWYQRVMTSGVPVVLSGTCISACTIVLELPPEQVCAMPGARLGFHAVTIEGKVDLDSTKDFANEFYPPAVREWFLKLPFVQNERNKKNTVFFRSAADVGIRACQ